jgi:hypothetical protein
VQNPIYGSDVPSQRTTLPQNDSKDATASLIERRSGGKNGASSKRSSSSNSKKIIARPPNQPLPSNAQAAQEECSEEKRQL